MIAIGSTTASVFAFFLEDTGEYDERQLNYGDREAERFYRDEDVPITGVTGVVAGIGTLANVQSQPETAMKDLQHKNENEKDTDNGGATHARGT